MERVYAAVFLVLVGAGAVHVSIGYGIGNSLEPGSGYFPMILGVLLAVLGTAIAVREFRGRREVAVIGRWPVRPLACIIGGLVVFAVLLGGGRSLGFRGAGLVPAMFVLVFITGLANQQLSFRENLLLSALLTAISLVIFVALFGLAIPLWPWSY